MRILGSGKGGRKDAGLGQYLNLATVGIEMGAALAVGMGLGWFLDGLFGTRPWMIVIFTGFGIAAGFMNLLRVGREQARKLSETPDEGNDRS